MCRSGLLFNTTLPTSRPPQRGSPKSVVSCLSDFPFHRQKATCTGWQLNVNVKREFRHCFGDELLRYSLTVFARHPHDPPRRFLIRQHRRAAASLAFAFFANAVLVWAPAHHGARSCRADPMATRPTPSALCHPSLTPAATSSGYLALWRTPVCLGAPRLTVVYRFKFLLGLLEQRLARCSPPSCARSG